MFTINKLITLSPVDYAAEELKKYLRMMMPNCGDIAIRYDKDAQGGFRLGIMADLDLTPLRQRVWSLTIFCILTPIRKAALLREAIRARYFWRCIAICARTVAFGFSPVWTENISRSNRLRL